MKIELKNRMCRAVMVGWMAFWIGAIAACGLAQPAPTDPKEILRQLGRRNVRVHDPSAIIKCKNEYWIFYTGVGVPSIHSGDLVNWSAGHRVFAAPPSWVKQAVPANRGDFWAPDVIRIGNRYMLFVSASSFGKNTSAIGVTTNTTLDPADPAYHWSDSGIVVQSRENDDYNCIDPCAFQDSDGRVWLSFGSFWSGIKLIELDPATGRRIALDSPMYNLAHWDAIEASYLYHHGQHYYLFASFGMCCRGIYSTYNTRVGRADKITGPYLDKNGTDMLLGGGTLVAATDGPLVGPGQAGIFEENGLSWFSCHFYDATANGSSRLSIRPLTWSDDGWPVLGKLNAHP
jgi:arabinan endo-1,5-alpha-L-arabinosidase